MLDPRSNQELPAIPAKRYFTIGEVSELCAVKPQDRKSTRLNSSHVAISYAVFCLKKKSSIQRQRMSFTFIDGLHHLIYAASLNSFGLRIIYRENGQPEALMLGIRVR